MASPAACLLPQIRERAALRNRRVSDRDFDGDDSPGKLFTYVSAGNIELPGDDRRRRMRLRRSPRAVFTLALILTLIWIWF